MKKSKVSVIIPCKDTGTLLLKAVESVFAQTAYVSGAADLEVLIIDDRSIDPATHGSMASLERRYDHVRVVQTNSNESGVSHARNLGIARSTGNLVSFLDADDLWEANHLATHLALHDRPDVALSASEYVYMDMLDATTSEGVMASMPHRRNSILAPCFEQKASGYFSEPRSLFIECCPAWTGAVVVARSALQASGLFNVHLKICEDVNLWTRVAGVGAGFAFTPEITARYRRRPDSLTNAPDAKSKSLWMSLHYIDLLGRPDFADCRREVRRELCASLLGYAWEHRQNRRFAESVYYALKSLRYSPFSARSYMELTKAALRIKSVRSDEPTNSTVFLDASNNDEPAQHMVST